MIARVVIGVDHAHAAGELRIREEEERPQPRKLRQRLAALDSRRERVGDRRHVVQREIVRKQAAHHVGSGLPRPAACVGGEQLVDERAVAARLHHTERIQEAVASELGLVDVVGAEQVFRAPADIRHFEERLAPELVLVRNGPRVRDRCLEFRVDNRDER